MALSVAGGSLARCRSPQQGLRYTAAAQEAINHRPHTSSLSRSHTEGPSATSSGQQITISPQSHRKQWGDWRCE